MGSSALWPFLAKELRGGEWRYLTIPPGGTAAYNKPIREKPPGPHSRGR